MKSLYSFIVKPYDDRYDNIRRVDGNNLIINTSIENHRFISKKAVVVSTPAAYNTKINIGDELYIHHNVFRRWYNVRGEEKNSKSYFKDGLYFVQQDQVYLYKRKNKWKAFGDRCFVAPLRDNVEIHNVLEQNLIGVLKYGNSVLEALEINEGDLVGYKPFGEYEFLVDGKRLYCMKSNDIVIKHERQGNEEEYNPSWAQSG